MNFESHRIRSTHAGMPVIDEKFRAWDFAIEDIPSLKPTTSSHLKMDGKGIRFTFPFGAFRPIFRVAFKLSVSGRVYGILSIDPNSSIL